jgi:ketol-acid reductoisomerase
MMARVYYDQDADLNDLAEEKIAVLGYGIQGRAQALNLRDSGLSVIVGNRDDTYREKARVDGFEVLSLADAAGAGDVIIVLVPDEAQGEVYEQSIRPGLAPGNALVFAHGFAIRYGIIQPPHSIDLLLLAPRLPGKYLRERYLEGSGVPVYVDVGHDSTGRAKRRVLALAKALGATRVGAMEVSFAQETELDHFSEHFVYPLIVTALQVAYEVLVEEGYEPEAALMELHGSGELGEVLLEAGKIGLHRMIETLASPACQFGIYSYAPRLFPDEMRRVLKDVIGEIKDGSFARQLLAEQQQGYRRLRTLKDTARNHPLTATELRLRQLIRLERK